MIDYVTCTLQARQMQIIKELVGTKGNQSYNLLSEEDRHKLAFLNNSNPYGGASPRWES